MKLDIQELLRPPPVGKLVVPSVMHPVYDSLLVDAESETNLHILFERFRRDSDSATPLQHLVRLTIGRVPETLPERRSCALVNRLEYEFSALPEMRHEDVWSLLGLLRTRGRLSVQIVALRPFEFVGQAYFAYWGPAKGRKEYSLFLIKITNRDDALHRIINTARLLVSTPIGYDEYEDQEHVAYLRGKETGS